MPSHVTICDPEGAGIEASQAAGSLSERTHSTGRVRLVRYRRRGTGAEHVRAQVHALVARGQHVAGSGEQLFTHRDGQGTELADRPPARHRPAGRPAVWRTVSFLGGVGPVGGIYDHQRRDVSGAPRPWR